MIARVAATDTPTTQIAAVNTSNPAGPRRPGGAGTAAPTPPERAPRRGPAAAGAPPPARGPRWFTKSPVAPDRPDPAPLSGCDDAPTPSSPQPPWKVTLGVAASATPGASNAPPTQAAASTGPNRCRSIR